MIKRVAPLALGFALLIASCASMPNPNAKRTSDDCLVLIRTSTIAGSDAPKDREYTFKFSDSIANRKVPLSQEGYIAIHVRRAGAKIIGLTSKVGGNSQGESTSTDLDMPLPYAYGQIVVTPLTFVHTIKKTGEREYLSIIEFVPTPKEAAQKLIEQYKLDHPKEGW